MVKSILIFFFVLLIFFPGTYESGVGSLASHPYQYQTNNHKDHQQPVVYSNDHHQSSYSIEHSKQIVKNNQQQLNSHTSKMNEKTQNNHNKENYGTTKMIQLPPKKILNNKNGESKNPSLVNTYCKKFSNEQFL
jgi:hypothetical protein